VYAVSFMGLPKACIAVRERGPARTSEGSIGTQVAAVLLPDCCRTHPLVARCGLTYRHTDAVDSAWDYILAGVDRAAAAAALAAGSAAAVVGRDSDSSGCCTWCMSASRIGVLAAWRTEEADTRR
jgi:hypothetical protein